MAPLLSWPRPLRRTGGAAWRARPSAATAPGVPICVPRMPGLGPPLWKRHLPPVPGANGHPLTHAGTPACIAGREGGREQQCNGLSGRGFPELHGVVVSHPHTSPPGWCCDPESAPYIWVFTPSFRVSSPSFANGCISPHGLLLRLASTTGLPHRVLSVEHFYPVLLCVFGAHF